MIDKVIKSDCTGCTACYSICPRHCISMKEDSEGFLYPNINSDLCIHCNRCEQVCPVLDMPQRYIPQKGLVVRSKRMNEVRQGTSGAVIPAICKYILQAGGAVVSASYNDDLSVSHKLYADYSAWKESEKKIQGSKYVSSRIEDSLADLKKYAMSGKKCAYIGTPCQIAGARNGLKKAEDNVIFIEFICHGLPSQKILDKYIEYLENKYNQHAVSINFRSKRYDYHNSCMEVRFSNHKRYLGFKRTDLMLRSYFSGLASRMSCYHCPMKGKERAADITVFDCWHSEELAPESRKDSLGYTNVLVNTAKGFRIWNEVSSSYESYEADIDEMIAQDGIMITENPEMHPGRERYYQEIDQYGIDGAMKKEMPITEIDRLRIFIKKAILQWKYGAK